MNLYLMRHGEAVQSLMWEGSDETRPLSDRGRASVEEAALRMQNAGFLAKKVFSSPFVRAKETATIVAEKIQQKELYHINELASGARNKDFRYVVVKNKNLESLLLVGHVPDLVMYAAYVTEDPDMMELGRMEPGEMWAVQVNVDDNNNTKGKFLWGKKLNEW